MERELRDIALKSLKGYLDAVQDGRRLTDIQAERDSNRAQAIDTELRPLVRDYLGRVFSTADFKRQIDGASRQHPHWGFRGINGQMFFNMLFNVVEDLSQSDIQARTELDNQLRLALREPESEETAATSLTDFHNYVKQVGQKFVNSGGEPAKKPRPRSVLFFLSYFWQIHRPNIWPVFFPSTTQVTERLNFWQITGDVGEDYLAYKRLIEELAILFSEKKPQFGLYDVEHVFWFVSETERQAPLSPVPSIAMNHPVATPAAITTAEPAVASSLVLDSYIPPVVAFIPRLASNDSELQDVARRSGTTLERAFEKSINAAFTILGYETRLLGQGAGRVPDGQAIAVNESYAVLWDAKARSDGYKMGTDDRVIRQYIDTLSRTLKQRGIRNIYYLIISGRFVDTFDELVRSLKMETHVNEVCFVEAEALVEIVNQKLREPLAVSLGPDSVQRLFTSSGIITVSDVLDQLT